MDDTDVFSNDVNDKLNKEYSRKRQRDIDDLKKILKMPEGRRFVLKLISETGVFRASFTLNSMTTAFNEGKRDNGQTLLLWLHDADPMAYSQMLREYYSEAKSKKQEE